MPQLEIKITNMAEIRAAFKKAPFLMARELSAAIKTTLMNIKAQSMINTPVDTGRLRASTYTKWESLKGEVGTDVFYDIYVHEGTRYMRARPYLANAIEQEQNRTDQTFTRAVSRVLEQIGGMT